MTEHLKTLIQLLSDGEFHSGEELGSALGLTRSAIWKLAQQFPAWDIELESRTNKGYRIPNGLRLLDAAQIITYIPTEQAKFLSHIDILDNTTSTNDYLKPFVSTLPVTPRACFAEKQTAGRGRFGRPWASPYASNIYLSLLWPSQKDLNQLSGLSLAIAVAIINALKEYGLQETILLKWPNDIMYDNKKLAGVLIELSGEVHGGCNTIIGIGLNTNMPKSFGEKIDRPYTDIASITNTMPNRNQLAGLLLKHVLFTLQIFAEQGMKPFLTSWKALDISFGKAVNIITPTTEVSGISRGIDEHGFFLLEDKNGLIQHFSSGEVSLRL